MAQATLTYHQLENTANKLLEMFGQQNTDFVDVVSIAQNLGYNIISTSFDKDISGMVVCNDKEKSIYINKDDYSRRKRFTIAHEIGHILLHHIDNDEYFVDYRNKSTYDAKEFEADNFAAALLMPREISIANWQKTQDIDDFANLMQVSKAAAAIRLMNLGLIQL